MYNASDETMVYLINEAMTGTPERRLAAKFILDCIRVSQAAGEISHCIEGLADSAILDIEQEARQLAEQAGLTRA